MIKADLITGYLGAGKTTFIKKYAEFLISGGKNIGILENDYGAVNVDMMLLQDLEGDNCELEMVAGGCHPDCHRRRFKSKLISMGMCGYDRVIVEPSGVFDVDEFFDLLYEDPLDRWYEIGNIITIVDAKLPAQLSASAQYLLAVQLSSAGQILLSRGDEASPEQIEELMQRLNGILEKFRCSRRIGNDFLAADLRKLSPDRLAQICGCGYQQNQMVKLPVMEENEFSTEYFMNLGYTEEIMEQKIRALFDSRECGDILRIKGFSRSSLGGWTEWNATCEGIRKAPIREGQDVLIIIGERLCKEEIQKRI